jgi:rare lipoprotein A
MAVGGFASSALAACIVCAAVGNGNAATNQPAGFATVPFVAPASPVGNNEPVSTSFNERFEVPQASRVREMLASLTYYVPQTELTTASLPRRQKIVASGAAIVGIASTYNPTDAKDMDAGNEELASGERYDANGWTAAIRTDLRAQFGGVRFGKNYQPAFALVETSDKQVIVRINDIGPLKRGRIIDLNERTMRYFDPTMQIGIIDKVKVTPLAGQTWALGPLDDDRPVSVASRFEQEFR